MWKVICSIQDNGRGMNKETTMKGAIEVTSELGKGSTFTVILPEAQKSSL